MEPRGRCCEPARGSTRKGLRAAGHCSSAALCLDGPLQRPFHAPVRRAAAVLRAVHTALRSPHTMLSHQRPPPGGLLALRWSLVEDAASPQGAWAQGLREEGPAFSAALCLLPFAVVCGATGPLAGPLRSSPTKLSHNGGLQAASLTHRSSFSGMRPASWRVKADGQLAGRLPYSFFYLNTAGG